MRVITCRLVTSADVRKFCSKHAFDIGAAFRDETLEKLISMASTKASKLSFKSDRAKRTWITAFVCRECCENAAEGPDKTGAYARSSFSVVFGEIMRRQGC